MPEKRHEDAALKRLFARPEVVRSYLDHAPLPAELQGALDFTTLQKLSTEFVSDSLMTRHADLLWQVDYHGGAGQLYVIVEIEFQSSPDAAMPLRMLTYAALIYESLWREAKPREESYRLPAVIPLVIYTGEDPWNVPQAVDALMGQDLKELRPSFQFLLIDERRLTEAEGKIKEGPAGDLMLFRHARDYGMMLEACRRIIRSEIYQSNQSIYAELAQDFGRRTLATEVQTMNDLGTRLEEMNQRAIEQGKSVGIEFVALQMIEKEVPVEEIQSYTGLTLEQIQELRRSN